LIALVLLFYGLTDSAGLFVENIHCTDATFQSLSNLEWGPFSTAYQNPEHGYRPEYGVRFEKLNVSNRSVGFLRTALHQNLELEHLKLVFFSYTQDCRKDSKGMEDDSRPFDDKDVGVSNFLNPKSFLRFIQARLSSNPDMHFYVPDISKTTRVSITDFSVGWKIDEQAVLTIQSRRAVWAVQRPHEVELLGRVILGTPNGTLQTNRVVWDTDKEIFYVPGRYYSSAPCQRFNGQNDVMDYRLNILANSSLSDLSKRGGPLWSAGE
jgi:hypothetical protein